MCVLYEYDRTANRRRGEGGLSNQLAQPALLVGGGGGGR